MRKRSRWLALGAGVLGLGVVVGVAALGSSCRAVQHFESPAQPVSEIDHADYQSLLAAYVSGEGRVDYQRWKDSPNDVARLDRYVAALASAPPDVRPELYAGKPERLSYWLNLYNSIVLREVIRRYPIDSVNEVMPTATSFLKQGKGFFYDLHYQVGSREMNLLEIENEIIRGRFQDARIHFALNCASNSCPG